MNRTPSRRPRGFSLVEIVIALGLVSFSMLVIFALMAHGQKTSRESRLESVAALLSGKAVSALRSAKSWETPQFSEYTDSRTLADIAQGGPVTLTNYYNNDLERLADSADPSQRAFAMVSSLGPFDPALLRSPDADVSAALARLPAAANTVTLHLEVSFPANAPKDNRSTRHFSAILGRPSRN
jgi:type II secretory pathway pseudopilin PulG